MKRNTTLLLSVPVALALASCGMTAQYSYQQYQDGIYGYGGTYVPREEVTIYSVEDFEAMAAARIAEKQGTARDTVYVVLEDNRDSDIYLSFGLAPFLLWDSWYLPDPWEYRIWYNHYRWYDPWYYGHWYDPWYHGHWYHDPWHVGPRPPRPGLSPDGRRYFGERRFTQSPGRRERVPGTGSNRRNPGSVTRPGIGGGAYGSAGSTVLRPSSGGSSIGSGAAPSHNPGAAGSSVRTRYSNRQSSPSINIGSGTRPSQAGGSSIGSGARPVSPNSGSSTGTGVRSRVNSGSSSVRSGGTSTRRNDSYRSSGSTTVRRNPSTPSSTRSGSTTRSRSSFSSPGSSSRPSSSYSSGFSGGSRSSGSFSGGSRPSGGGARRR